MYGKLEPKDFKKKENSAFSDSTDNIVDYTPNLKRSKQFTINHFQGANMKKSQSVNTIAKKSEIYRTDDLEITALNNNKNSFNYNSPLNSNKNSNSSLRSSKQHHVQFALPVYSQPGYNSNSRSSINNSPQTSSNTNSSTSTLKNTEFRNLNISNISTNKGSLNNLNKSLNQLPLKNITTIRSSSFRQAKMSNSKTELSKNSITGPRNEALKVISSKSVENITAKQTDDKQQPNNTHTINKLLNIATTWNNKTRTGSASSASNQSKAPDRSLISQIKIRQAQIFLSDESEYTDSESALSRKIAEINEKTNKFNLNDDTSSDKNIRVDLAPKMPMRIMPYVNRYDSAAHSKKSSISEDNETVDDKLINFAFWPASTIENSASQLSDNGSIKETSITNYLSKIHKSYKLLHANKNMNFMKNNNTSNRISQLQIQT